MSTLSDIEAAIQRLPAGEIEQLAQWFDTYRMAIGRPVSIEEWLEEARGAARPGVATADVMALTRGEG